MSRMHIILQLLAGFLVGSSLALGPTAHAIDLLKEGHSFIGEGYSMGKDERQLLFHLDRSLDAKEGVAHAIFKDLEGRELVTEVTRYDSKGAVTAYEVRHHQLGERGLIEAVGDKLVFSKWAAGESEPTRREEPLVANWVVGPSLVPLIAYGWSDLEAGKRIPVRLALWDRQETIGFEVFKDRVETAPDGRSHAVIKLKPSNFLISALVNPVLFGFGMDGRSLDWVKGRVLPLRQAGSKLKSLDAEVVYLSRPKPAGKR
jgi:hypothetical protein